MCRLNGMVWIAGPAALALGLAAFALAGGPAVALTPHSLDSGASLVLPVTDQEDLSVEEDLVPDEVPAPKTKSGEEMMPAPERPDTGGDMEDSAIEKDLETGE
ncbi:hypothetical protein [Methyloceanibacter methanicus]|uniref:hypothetical protein n=1 Tax=Methyloceanibacter methanicus TaxID=1774968 RepID=UPI00114C9C70|nr:hypothetical protein [Methyloceanibacter methanicus]